MLAIHDYQSVITLNEERHFARAADALGITQPALTSRLRRIENHVGARLFERSRKGVSPTRAGVAFIESARRIVEMAAEADAVARDAATGHGQLLRVGMTNIAANPVVLPVLTAFRAAHPNVRVRLIEGATASLCVQVEQRLLDIAFAHPPIHEPGLSEFPLCDHALVKYQADEPTLPAIRYIRREAPVLVAEISRKMPESRTQESQAEVDTALGAMVLAGAGYGPCIVPDTILDWFGRNLSGFGVEETALSLGTSIIWRSLDRSPATVAMISVAKQFAEQAA